jgi:hypothetical protein
MDFGLRRGPGTVLEDRRRARQLNYNVQLLLRLQALSVLE